MVAILSASTTFNPATGAARQRALDIDADGQGYSLFDGAMAAASRH